MYILKELKKRYYMPNGYNVTVSTLKPGTHMFSFSEYSCSSTDCGFIKTDLIALRSIFADTEISKVLNLCERKHNENTNITSHCIVKDDPKLKNNIPTCTDGVNLNCLHP